jgi:endonuclease III
MPTGSLPIPQVMRALSRAIADHDLPAVEKIARSRERQAFHVLIGTLLSARTQDATTAAASDRLFRAAATPAAMARLTPRQIEKLIYPVSFYRNKAQHVRATCRLLMDRFDGQVPETMSELLTLPGVGRKTANLVLILAFGSRDNICVDTHVHRRWWADINLYLVTWGQNVCRPIRPRCAACVIGRWCPRIGVK